MKIEKDANVAIVVNQAWANLHGIKMFLRQGESSQANLRGVDESHVLFAKVLDAGDSAGVWIQLPAEKSGEDPGLDSAAMLIPWSQVLTIVLAEEFSPAIRREARRIGFSGEIERD